MDWQAVAANTHDDDLTTKVSLQDQKQREFWERIYLNGEQRANYRVIWFISVVRFCLSVDFPYRRMFPAPHCHITSPTRSKPATFQYPILIAHSLANITRPFTLSTCLVNQPLDEAGCKKSLTVHAFGIHGLETMAVVDSFFFLSVK